MNPAEFDNIARAERDFWWYRGMREILYRLLDRFPVGPGASVLEAGCGTGYMSKLLTERYGWRMTPLDLGREGLEYARGYGLDRLMQGDISALPFAAGAFDAVVSLDVVVHLPRGREGAALEEFARVVKPGGLLAVRVSALDVLHSRHSEFAHERQRFTRARLSRAVEAAGFRVELVTYVNSLLLPVSLFKFRIWEPLARAPAASGVAAVPGWLDGLLFGALRTEAAWVGNGGSFPAGQSLVLIARRR
jgi:ubiquinone/menaquinone biosynthesis C-methylase UbiE